MRDILFALGHSIRSLLRLDVFGHLIWPGVVSALFWLVVAVMSWAAVIDACMQGLTGLGWGLGDWISTTAWVSVMMLFLVKIVVMLAFVPLFYVTSTFLVAVIALPRMLDRVAKRDYADLEQRRGGSDAGSIGNALLALLGFVLIFVLSLPLWLIPGVALVAPVLATGWLNQRMFSYDALMRHADREELIRLRGELRPPLLVLGGSTALLAYIPVVNVIAPALSGLAFVHFLLDALRRDRLERGTSILDPEPGPESAHESPAGWAG
jgi:hypothetical protein